MVLCGFAGRYIPENLLFANCKNRFSREVSQSRDQARGQNEGEVFLMLGRSFCPSFIHAYIICAFKFLPKLRTERSLILQGDYFDLVSLYLDPFSQSIKPYSKTNQGL